MELNISVLLDAPPAIRSAFVRLRYLIPPGGFVAGGWLRDAVADLDAKDVDYFFTTPESLFSASLDLGQRGARFLYATPNAVGLDFDGQRIELVSAHVGDTIACLSGFDFVANCAAITADGRYIRHPDFEDHARRRLLRVLNPKRASATKVDRLQARGWCFDGHRTELSEGEVRFYGC